MSKSRWSLAALLLAPVLAAAGCDQVGAIWNRTGASDAGPGPAALDSVPLEARALSGALQRQEDMAALLAPQPLLIAPGQIIVGARVEAELAETASDMGLASNFVRALRANGEDALQQLPEQVMTQVRARAEAEAATKARRAVQDVLGRLGVEGEVEVRSGGLLTVDLASGVSPTALRFSQLGGPATTAPQGGEPEAIEWNTADRCPRIVTQGQLESDVALATRCAIQRLQATRQFQYVEPNYIADADLDRLPRPKQAQTTTTASTRPDGPPTATAIGAATTPRGGMPNDPLLALQWDLRVRGADQGQSAGGAGFVAFWQAMQVGSREVSVAVLDTGIDLTHPDIRNSHNVGPGVDLISNIERGGDGDGIDADAQDVGDHCGAAEDSYHGTHVAGIIGATATNDRVGVAGGAWDVTVMPVRVIGRCGGELADIVSGVRWAAALAPATGADGAQIVNRKRADIINLSLSIQTACPASLQAAINAAVAANVVVVVAAGNKANQAALFAPANCNNVIVVGAGDGSGGLAFYSNFGPQVDIVAPGGDLFSDNDNDGKPDGILSTRATRSGCYDPLNQNSTDRCYYSFLQGTSMAAPHVSAALALLAAQSGLRGRALENALFSRAVSPLPAGFGQIECARSRYATPVSEGSTTCARPSGRGYLDLALAARALAPEATP